ncbi:amidase [Streptomyces aureus]|uniref:Amidase n=1 Tax=Streptomyces aureus TaxID=193461 RepID=A0ABV4SMW7_9ACTN
MNRTPPDTPISVADAGRQLRTGELTATQLLVQVVSRIEATEPRAHAYASLDLDAAFAAAAEADRTPARGPLHGIPFGLKDVFAVRGMRTTCGQAGPDGEPSTVDAPVLTSLRRAGGVLLGLQVTHELTCGVDEPPTRDPAHPEHYAGGSSVGSAVSVAIGSSLFALGTDAAGSVRIPASATGIVGLKPTRGLLSRQGIARVATAPSIDHVGILARSVADVRIVLETLAPGSTRHGGASGPALKGARIGVLHHRDVGEDPEVTAAFATLVMRLVDLGATPVPVELAELTRAPSVTGTVFMTELAAGNRDLFRRAPASYHPAVADLIRAGLAVPRSDARQAHEERWSIAAAVETLLRTHRLDALALPTMPVPPPPLADLNPPTDLPRLTALTCPFNLSGHPALTIPSGTTRDGLPIGSQLVGRREDEATLLRIAQELSTAHEAHHPQER